MASLALARNMELPRPFISIFFSEIRTMRSVFGGRLANHGKRQKITRMILMNTIKYKEGQV